MTTQKFFEVSTVHVPNDKILNVIQPSIVIAEYNEGWFCWIPPKEQFYQYPVWLVEIFKLALSEDCHHIVFDADGTDYDQLQKFDW